MSGARGDSGADASHRTVQAWMGSNEKTAREGTPEPKKKQKSTANCDSGRGPVSVGAFFLSSFFVFSHRESCLTIEILVGKSDVLGEPG